MNINWLVTHVSQVAASDTWSKAFSSFSTTLACVQVPSPLTHSAKAFPGKAIWADLLAARVVRFSPFNLSYKLKDQLEVAAPGSHLIKSVEITRIFLCKRGDP